MTNDIVLLSIIAATLHQQSLTATLHFYYRRQALMYLILCIQCKRATGNLPHSALAPSFFNRVHPGIFGGPVSKSVSV